jgi:hypothetical protein
MFRYTSVCLRFLEMDVNMFQYTSVCLRFIEMDVSMFRCLFALHLLQGQYEATFCFSVTRRTRFDACNSYSSLRLSVQTHCSGPALEGNCQALKLSLQNSVSRRCDRWKPTDVSVDRHFEGQGICEAQNLYEANAS